MHPASSTQQLQATRRSLESELEMAVRSGELRLQGKHLLEFPSTLGKHFGLADTRDVDLSKNKLQEVPRECTQFPSLERLTLHHNTIRTIPDCMVSLQALQHLDLSRNQLTYLPPAICQLTLLQSLIVDNNKLVSLPEEVGELTNLMQLDVSCNEIAHLPLQIGDLANLRHLNLRRNHLQEVPVELTYLQLTVLDLSSNRISNLPVELRFMLTLVDLDLSENPLSCPPANLCGRGRVHIFKYLENIAIKEDKKRGILADTEQRRSYRKTSQIGDMRFGALSADARLKRHTADSGYGSEQPMQARRWSTELQDSPPDGRGHAEDARKLAHRAISYRPAATPTPAFQSSSSFSPPVFSSSIIPHQNNLGSNGETRCYTSLQEKISNSGTNNTNGESYHLHHHHHPPPRNNDTNHQRFSEPSGDLFGRRSDPEAVGGVGSRLPDNANNQHNNNNNNISSSSSNGCNGNAEKRNGSTAKPPVSGRDNQNLFSSPGLRSAVDNPSRQRPEHSSARSSLSGLGKEGGKPTNGTDHGAMYSGRGAVKQDAPPPPTTAPPHFSPSSSSATRQSSKEKRSSPDSDPQSVAARRPAVLKSERNSHQQQQQQRNHSSTPGGRLPVPTGPSSPRHSPSSPPSSGLSSPSSVKAGPTAATGLPEPSPHNSGLPSRNVASVPSKSTTFQTYRQFKEQQKLARLGGGESSYSEHMSAYNSYTTSTTSSSSITSGSANHKPSVVIRSYCERVSSVGAGGNPPVPRAGAPPDTSPPSPPVNQEPYRPKNGGGMSNGRTAIPTSSRLYNGSSNGGSLSRGFNGLSIKDADKPHSTAKHEAKGHAVQDAHIHHLRQQIEMRLKISLGDDLPGCLTDGVVLCHMVNHVAPRSVNSIHVPSPAVPKLSAAKCRRNVDNFLGACRKIGVREDLVCSPADIMEPSKVHAVRVAITVMELLRFKVN